jgi:hypothetical protein
MRIICNNKGISLVILIVIMLGMALIGGGIASVMSSKQKSYPYAVNSFNAYEIANAGAEFAIRYYKDNATFPPLNTSISFGGGTFTLSGDISPNNQIISIGTYRGVTRQVKVVNFSTYASSTGDVSFDNPVDMASFSPIESQSGQVIVVNPATGTISLGQGATETFGAIWYGGNAVAGDCINGSCNFGTGFRAYFIFQFATGSTGDGFTFAVISGNGADYNDKNSVGGDTSMGELMAYGGDSRKYSPNNPVESNISLFTDYKGIGIKPPKFGVEFDIYHNDCGAVCSGAGSRCDTSNQHMTYVFWGNNNTMGCAPEDVSMYLRWMPSMTYAANTVVYPSSSNGHIYRALNDGTSGATQPAWPTANNTNSSLDGSITWRECAWEKSPQTFSVGNIIAPTTVDGYFDPAAANGRFYRCSSATGTRRSGNSEPTWCTSSGCMVRDNRLYWTEASVVIGTVSFPGNSRTYDDNRHTAGSGGNYGSSIGTGPANTTSSNNYYTSPTNPTTWLADTASPSTVNPKYAYRMEVVRDSIAGTYQIKSWVKPCTDGTANCDMYTNSALGNVGSDYNPNPADNPTLNRTITLDSTYNTAFNKFLFGWTVATGAATQIADVKKFRMNFKP